MRYWSWQEMVYLIVHCYGLCSSARPLLIFGNILSCGGNWEVWGWDKCFTDERPPIITGMLLITECLWIAQLQAHGWMAAYERHSAQECCSWLPVWGKAARLLLIHRVIFLYFFFLCKSIYLFRCQQQNIQQLYQKSVWPTMCVYWRIQCQLLCYMLCANTTNTIWVLALNRHYLTMR